MTTTTEEARVIAAHDTATTEKARKLVNQLNDIESQRYKLRSKLDWLTIERGRVLRKALESFDAMEAAGDEIPGWVTHWRNAVAR